MSIHKHKIALRGEIKTIDKPIVMGILNATPDSFYENSRTINEEDIYKKVREITEEGADWIDVGGYSSRPGADNISEQAEINRIKIALNIIKTDFPAIPVSVDTFRSSVAEWAIEHYNIDIINDISGGKIDSKILNVAAEANKVYIGMHLKGNPQTMQTKTNYNNLIKEIKLYFAELLNKANKLGIADLIIDPGFGFAKTLDQNYDLLNTLNEFDIFKKPILVGLSRKSMIYKYLKINAEESLTGTIALNTIALQKEASILRVHDVKEAVQTAKLYTKTNK
jgi:dihydropteroate synthase